MIRIHIFTYKEDAPEAVAAARCARMACPSALVRVLDDCHAPVDAGTVEALEKLGAVYDQTSWMRGGEFARSWRHCGGSAFYGGECLP